MKLLSPAIICFTFILSITTCLAAAANPDNPHARVVRAGNQVDLSTSITVVGCLSDSKVAQGYTLTDEASGATYSLAGNTESLPAMVGSQTQVTGQLINSDAPAPGDSSSHQTNSPEPSVGPSPAGRVILVSVASKLTDHCGVTGARSGRGGMRAAANVYLLAALTPPDGQAMHGAVGQTGARKPSTTTPTQSGNPTQGGTPTTNGTRTPSPTPVQPNNGVNPNNDPCAAMAAAANTNAVAAQQSVNTAPVNPTNPGAFGTTSTTTGTTGTTTPFPGTTSAPIPGATMMPGPGTTSAPIPGETVTPSAQTTSAPAPGTTAGTMAANNSAASAASSGVNSANGSSGLLGSQATNNVGSYPASSGCLPSNQSGESPTNTLPGQNVGTEPTTVPNP